MAEPFRYCRVRAIRPKGVPWCTCVNGCQQREAPPKGWVAKLKTSLGHLWIVPEPCPS